MHGGGIVANDNGRSARRTRKNGMKGGGEGWEEEEGGKGAAAHVQFILAHAACAREQRRAVLAVEPEERRARGVRHSARRRR